MKWLVSIALIIFVCGCYKGRSEDDVYVEDPFRPLKRAEGRDLRTCNFTPYSDIGYY